MAGCWAAETTTTTSLLRSSCGVRPSAVVSRRIAVEPPLLHAGSRALLIYCSVLCLLSIHICHLAALLYAYSPHHSPCCTPPREPTAPLENDGQCGGLRALLRFPRASPYPSSSSSFFGPERWHAYTDYMQRLVSVRFVESFPAPLPSPSPFPPLSFVVCRLLASPNLSSRIAPCPLFTLHMHVLPSRHPHLIPFHSIPSTRPKRSLVPGSRSHRHIPTPTPIPISIPISIPIYLPATSVAIVYVYDTSLLLLYSPGSRTWTCLLLRPLPASLFLPYPHMHVSRVPVSSKFAWLSVSTPPSLFVACSFTYCLLLRTVTFLHAMTRLQSPISCTLSDTTHLHTYTVIPLSIVRYPLSTPQAGGTTPDERLGSWYPPPWRPRGSRRAESR